MTQAAGVARARPVLVWAAALLLGALLAGCAVELPDAKTPEKPGHAWTDAAELWVARDLRCGFGPSGADEGCATLTLLYRDGAVLRVTYGEGGPEQVEGYPAEEGNRRGLTFAWADQDAAHRDEVAAAWQSMHGKAPHLVRVHDAVALRMDPTEREDVLRVVEHAIGKADPLGEPTYDCEDCVAPTYWTFGAPATHARQRFSIPATDDGGWALLEDQVQALHAWLEDQPEG